MNRDSRFKHYEDDTLYDAEQEIFEDDVEDDTIEEEQRLVRLRRRGRW